MRPFLWHVSMKYNEQRIVHLLLYNLHTGFVTCRIHYKLSLMFLQSIVPTHGVTISMTTADLSITSPRTACEHDGIICNKMSQY